MIAWLLVLAGCTPATVRFVPDLWVWDTAPAMDSGDSGDEPEGPGTELLVDPSTVSWGCNGVGTAWTLTFRTTAWSGGATFNVFGPDPWSEEHLPLLVDSSATGAWDAYNVGPLPDGTAQDAQVPGVNTVFDCATDVGATTQVILLRDRFGSIVDCVVWGASPASATSVLQDPAVTAIGGCRTITES